MYAALRRAPRYLVYFFLVLCYQVGFAQTDPLPTVTIGAGTGSEGGSISFLVSISESVSDNVSFKYVTSIATGDTAEIDDFTAVTDGSATITAGEKSVSITVAAASDSVDEPSETFTVTISNVTPDTVADLGSASTAKGTITDDTAAPTISIADAGNVTEGAGGRITPMTFTLSLTGSSEFEIPMRYTFNRKGTATPAGDMELPIDRTFTISAGDTSKNLVVNVLNDPYYEHGGGETVVVDIFRVANSPVQVSRHQGTGTIIDDESPPQISIANRTLTYTEGTSVPIDLGSTVFAEHAVNVTLSITADLGTSASDYTQNISTLTMPGYFNSTSTKNVVTLPNDAIYEGTKSFQASLSGVSPSGAATVPSGSVGFQIKDSTTAPKISIGDASADEGDNLTFTIHSSTKASENVTVQYYTSASTAATTDFSHISSSNPSTATISRNTLSTTITIASTEDEFAEENETFTVTLSGITSRLDGISIDSKNSSGTGTIKDDDAAAQPSLSISGPSSNTDEGDTMAFSLLLSGTSGSVVSAPFIIGGTTSSSDYTVTSSPVSIAKGTTSATISVVTKDDVLYEGNETVIVTLRTPTNATLDGDADSATGTVVDNEPLPTLSIANVDVTEGDAATLTITTATHSQRAISGTWTTTNNTATGGSDFEEGGLITSMALPSIGLQGGGQANRLMLKAPAPGDRPHSAQLTGSFTISSGSASVDISIPTTEDDVYEGDETFTVTIASSDETVATVSNGSATVTIEEDEAVPLLSMADVSVDENDGAATMTVTTATKSAVALTFSYVTAESTATSADFAHSTTKKSVTLAAEASSTTFDIAITDDTIDETDTETFTVSLSDLAPSGKASWASGGDSAVVTINDDDESDPTVAVANASAVTEGDDSDSTTNMTFTVSLSADAKKVVTVPYTLGGTATSGTDYTAHGASPSLTIAVGDDEATITVAIKGDVDTESNETVTVTLGTPTNATLAADGRSASGTIMDNDALPTVSVANASAVTEGDDSDSTKDMTFTVSLSAAAKKVVTVPYTLGGSATSGTDYVAHGTNPSLTIAVGDDEATITVAIKGDVDTESNETVTVTLGNPTNATIETGKGSASGTINDDDEPPDPTVAVANASAVTEGDDSDSTKDMTFAVSLSAEATKVVTVPYTLGGTATSGTDYVAHGASPSLTIGIGDDDATITVAIKGDVDTESNETVTVTLGNPTNATIETGKGSATGTITDNDALPTVSVANASAVTEGDDSDSTTNMTFTVSLSADAKKVVTVPYTLGGTATSGTDYTAHGASPSLTIAVGDDEATITVAIKGDVDTESNETVTVTLGTPTNATLAADGRSASGTIMDNDALPTVSVANASAVTEGDDSDSTKDMTFTVSLSAAAKKVVTVPYTLGGSATSGTDYVAHGTNPSLTIAVGDDEATITVAIKGDVDTESNETVTVTLGNPTNATIETGKGSASGTINDDDEPPDPTVAVANASAVTEGDDSDSTKDMTFAVSLSAEATKVVTVPYTLGGTATSGTDYVAHGASPSLTIGIGDDDATITVAIKGDVDTESNETVTVTLGNPTNATIETGKGSATGTITDNDALPTVSVANASAVTEGDDSDSTTNMTFTVSLSADAKKVVTVPYTLGGTATSGTDYTAHGASPSLTIAVGDDEATITVAIKGDVDTESNETVTVTLGTPTNATLAADGRSASGTIMDNDALPTVSVANASAVTEGDDSDSTKDMTFTVSLSAAAKKVVTVPYTLGGSATSGTDYVAHGTNPSLTIAVGDDEATITVAIKGDVDTESNETVTVTLGNPTNATIETGKGSASGTINDDDEPPDPTVAVANASAVTEGDDSDSTKDMTFAVSLSAEATKVVTVPYTLGGTATSGTDYVAHGASPSLTIGIGDDDATITVAIKGDVDTESNETVTVTLGNPTNATIETGKGSATGTITDNDALPTVSVANASAVTEGDDSDSTTNMTFTVSLSADAKKVVTVPYTLGGTATSGTDYTAHGASPSLTIAVGDDEATITVAIKGDVDTESNETVTVTLGTPTNATLAADGRSASGTIMDNDALPTVSVANASAVTEGDDSDSTKDMTFTVSLSAAAKKVVTVPYTLGGSATSGTDYVAHGTNPSLTIAVGDDEATITVAIKGDVDTEEAETVTVALGVPTNATIAEGGGSASGTILDNDEETVVVVDVIPDVRISNAASTLEGSAESGGELRFPVTLSESISEPLTVYFTIGGSASEGSDYVSLGSSPNIEIPANSDVGTIVLTLIGDAEDEGDEIVELLLRQSPQSEYKIAADGDTATGTIVNDDLPRMQLSATKLKVVEGESITYHLSLLDSPSQSFTITVDETSGTVRIEPQSIEFSPSDWDEPKSIEVTALADDDARPLSLLIAHSVRPVKFADVKVPKLQLQVLDEDSDGVLVSKHLVELDERIKGSYYVSLNAEPVSNVTVVPSPINSRALAVSRSMTFTPENWSEPQKVEITVLDNGAFVNNLTTISHRVYGHYYEKLVHPVVTVSIKNDLEPRVAVAPEQINLREGESATYAVVLSYAPAGIVTIAATSRTPSLISVSDPIEFDDSNWFKPRRFTVTSIDNNLRRDEQVVIDHEITGSSQVVKPSVVTVNVRDNDTPELGISEPFLIIDEGARVEYDVSLRSPPNDDVRVEISANEEVDDRITITRELLFSPESWQTPQTVHVIAHADSVDREFVRSYINHATVGGYDDAITASLPISVLDDDTKGAEISVSTLQILEGESIDYTVHLTSEPIEAVTLTPTLSDNVEHMNLVKLSSPLEFNNLNWHIPQRIAFEAAVSEVKGSTEFTIEHRSQGGGYDDVVHPPVHLTYIDRDMFGVTIHPNLLSIEAGEQATYQIRLNDDPGEELVVVVEPSVADVLHSPETIQFSSESWEEIQTVVVQVDKNARAWQLDPITLKHSITSGAHESISIEPVIVHVIEGDDTGVIVSDDSISLDEDDFIDVTLKLAAAPEEDVRIEPNYSRPGVFVFDPEVLVFTSEDWMEGKRLTIRTTDNEYLGILEETITWHASGDQHFENTRPAISKVVVFDNDAPTIISDQPLMRIKEGSSKPLQLRLSHPPSGEVVVEFRVDGDGITVEPSELTFTMEDWRTEKVISVNANDDDTVKHLVQTIECVAFGGGYDDAGVVETIVEVVENDEIGVEIDFPEFIHEGRSLSYSVVLKSRPTTRVRVTAISQNDDVVSVDGNVEFLPNGWNIPQNITLKSKADVNRQTEIVEFLHDIDGGTFGAIQVPLRRLEVIDDDKVGVRIHPIVLNLDEGDTTSYGVVLQQPPDGEVIVEAMSSDQRALMVSDPIEFTTTNSHIEQIFTVTSTANSLDEDTTFTITHSITGGGYDDVEIDDVGVQVRNKVAAESMPNRLSLAGSNRGVYSVRLLQEPTTDLVVRPAVSLAGILNILPSAGTIFASNWDQPLEFTVELADDFDSNAAIPAVEIAHSLHSHVEDEDDSFTNVAKLTVSLTAKQERLTIHASMLMQTRGTAVVDLTLPTEPTSSVFIGANSVPLRYVVAPTNISFTTRNWTDSQSISVQSNNDDVPLTPDAVREALEELTVISQDPRFSGAVIEVLNIADSAQAHQVAQSILEPLTGSIARLNANRVMTCIDAAMRDDRALLRSSSGFYLNPGEVESWEDGATQRDWLDLPLAVNRGSALKPGQSNSMNANVKLSDRIAFCSDTVYISTETRDDVMVSARGKSGYFGGSVWLNDRYLLGIGIGRLDQVLDWREASIDLEGAAEVSMNTVSPFVARLNENQATRVWAMASVGSGFLELTDTESMDSIYELAYQSLGFGGSWQLPSVRTLRLSSQGWWAKTNAISLEKNFENVHVESHGARVGASGDWNFKLGQAIQFGTTLSSGVLNDNAIGMTALENLLGLRLSHKVMGASAELQIHSLGTGDKSYRSTRLSAVLAYQGEACCNRSGPWFNFKIGETTDPVFADVSIPSSTRLNRYERDYGGEMWRFETGWRTNWRYLGISLNPAIWVSKSSDELRNFGLTNVHKVGQELSFKTRFFVRDRGEFSRDIGIQGQLDWAW